MNMKTADEPKMMDEVTAMRSTMNYAATSRLMASRLDGRLNDGETLLMRNEMSVKSFRRQVTKRTIL